MLIKVFILGTVHILHCMLDIKTICLRLKSLVCFFSNFDNKSQKQQPPPEKKLFESTNNEDAHKSMHRLQASESAHLTIDHT